MAKVSAKKGRPDKPGPRGRPSEAYRIWCETQALNRQRLKAIQDTVRDPEARHFATMNIHLDERAFGKVTQPVADVTPERPLTGDALADLLLTALPLLLQGRPQLATRLTGQAAVDAEFTVEE